MVVYYMQMLQMLPPHHHLALTRKQTHKRNENVLCNMLYGIMDVIQNLLIVGFSLSQVTVPKSGVSQNQN